MRRILLLMLLSTMLLADWTGAATAEPHKNQILVPASCDRGQNYTFVINGMSKVGQIRGSTDNIVIKRFTVTYIDSDGTRLGGDEFDQGNKNGVQSDLISCKGQTTTELQGLGTVTAVFEFQGFVTPRGKQ